MSAEGEATGFDDALRERWTRRAQRRVAEAGLRTGAARTRVIQVLATHGQCLIGAREIVQHLRDGGATGSQASVYRVLDELSGLGLLRRSVDDQGASRYEIADDDHHHHHFVDEQTGAVEAFEDAELEKAIVAAAARLGMDLTSHDIVLKGRRRGDAEPRGG